MKSRRRTSRASRSPLSDIALENSVACVVGAGAVALIFVLAPSVASWLEGLDIAEQHRVTVAASTQVEGFVAVESIHRTPDLAFSGQADEATISLVGGEVCTLTYVDNADSLSWTADVTITGGDCPLK